MYRFTKQTIGNFDIYTANPRVGDVHLRKFSTGVTPKNQASLNIYAAGTFCLTSQDFKQIIPAGHTSLDLSLHEYTPQKLYIEQVVSGPATRLCVSKTGGGAWIRRQVDISLDWIAEQPGILIYSDGSVKEVSSELLPEKPGKAVYCYTST